MTPRYDQYKYLGIAFTVFGYLFTIYSEWILNDITLTALGISIIILGLTLFFIPSNPVPSQEIRAMLEGSLLNIEALLEEFDAQGKAVYLPPRDGRGNAFIPIEESPLHLNLYKIPIRLLTGTPNEPGLFVFPPGSEIIRLALLPEDIGLEDALNYVLVDILEAANNVKLVLEKEEIALEINEPRSMSDFPRVNHSLGSVTVSVAGLVLAQIMGKLIYFDREEKNEKKVVAFFNTQPVVD
jgi:hypothetical protein